MTQPPVAILVAQPYMAGGPIHKTKMQGGLYVKGGIYALRCIKDWISTVLVLTQIARNISGKENDMGIWCDIQSHPARPHPLPLPLPHPKSHPHIFNTVYTQSVPTKLLLICRSNCSHFSLLDSSIVAVNRFLGRRMSNCARVSQKRRKWSPKFTHTQKILFFYSVLLYCHPPTDRSQQHVLQFIRQCSAYMSALSANQQNSRCVNQQNSRRANQ